ncbi:MAG: hypothetical protein WAV32_02780 [Halobacteriota archaeon]
MLRLFAVLTPGLPDSDTLFWRLSECASLDLVLQEYKKVVKRNIEAVKGQIRRRRFVVSIVSCDLRFILLVLPIPKISLEKDLSS